MNSSESSNQTHPEHKTGKPENKKADVVDVVDGSSGDESHNMTLGLLYKSNSQPDLLTVHTYEYLTLKPKYQVCHDLVSTLAGFLQGDALKQKIFLHFTQAFDQHARLRSGAYKRSAFLLSLVRVGLLENKAVSSQCRYAEKGHLDNLYTTFLRYAVLKTLAMCSVVCDGVLRRIVHKKEYELITYYLTKVSTVRAEVDVSCVQNRDSWQILFGQNVETRSYMLLVKTYMGFATSSQNPRYQDCQSIAVLKEVTDFMYQVEESGIIDLSLGYPLREVGAKKTQHAFYNALFCASSLAPSTNQMFSSISGAVSGAAEVTAKASETLDKTKESLHKIDQTVEALSASIASGAKDIREVAETVNSARPMIDRLMETLQPILDSMSKVSSSLAGIAKALEQMWKFTTRFLYVAFPIVFLVTVAILKPWLGPAIMQGIFAIVAVVGVVLYGYTISNNWRQWMDVISDYWRNQVQSLSEDEGVAWSQEEDDYILANLNAPTPAQRTAGMERLRQAADALLPKFAKAYDGEQDQPSEDQIGADLITLTSTIYCMIGVDYSKKDEMIKALKSITGVSAGAEKFINALTNFFAVIAMNTAAWFGFECQFAQMLDEKYAAWLKQADAYMSEEKTLTIALSQRSVDDLEAHIQEGTLLAVAFEKAGQKTIAHLMSNHLKNLQLVLVKVRTGMITMPRERVEPVCLFITGQPGSGKTVFAQNLNKALCLYELRDHPALLKVFEENPKAFMHTRGTDKWMESYDPRTITMHHDEFPLTKESTAEDSKQVALIAEVNVDSQPLPMANADLKGKLYYNHSYTVLTSNQMDLKSDMLLEQGALARRIHLAISIESKGPMNSALGKELDPDNWDITLLEDANVPGQILFKPTGLKLTMARVFNIMIGIHHMRKQLKKLSQPIEKDLFMNLIESAESRAYIMCSNFWKDMLHPSLPKRMPTHEELLTFMLTNKVELEKQGLNLSFLDNKGKGKEKPKEGQSPDPTKALTPEMKSAYSRAEALFKAPSRNQMAGESWKSWHDMYVDAAKPGNEQTTAKFSFLTNTLEATLFQNDVDRQPTSYMSGYSMCSSVSSAAYEKDDAVAADFAVDFILRHLEASPSANIATKTEATLGILMAFGKYHIAGFRLPSIEPYLRVDNTSSSGERAKKQVGVKVTNTLYSPIWSPYSALASFMKSVGLKNVFGLTAEEAAYISVSETDVVKWALEKGVELTDDVKRTFSTVMMTVRSCYQAYARGEMTLGKAIGLCSGLFVADVTALAYETYQSLKNTVDSIRNKLYNVAVAAHWWLKEHGWQLVASLAGVTILSGLYSFFSAKTVANLVSANQESSINTLKYINRGVGKKVKWVRAVAKSHNQADMHWRDNVLPPTMANMYYILAPGGKPVGMLIFIARKRAIMLSHYLTTLEKFDYDDSDVAMVISREGKEYKIRNSETKVLRDWDHLQKDLAVVDIQCPDLPLHRDITKHFASAKDVDVSLMRAPFSITMVNPSIVYAQQAVAEKVLLLETPAQLAAEVAIVGSDYPRLDCIAYPIPTKSGDCGSLIFYNGKIVGIHAHGNGAWGQATRINREMLAEAYASETEGADSLSEFEPLEVDLGWAYNNQAYDPETRSPLVVGVLSPQGSTYVKSDLVPWRPDCKAIVSTKFPCNAVVKNYGPVRAKYGPKEETFDREKMAWCAAVLGEHIRKLPNPNMIKRVLTPVEAICGIPGTSVSPMDHTTSPGWPWNYLKRDRKKIYDVKADGKIEFGEDYGPLIEKCNMDIKMMCQGINPLYIFSDSQKSELRAPEKVEQPRLIAGAPFPHTLLCKSHYGGFMAHLIDTWRVGPVLIGVDPHRDSHEIEMQFRVMGDGVRECTGDVRGFDVSRSPETMDYVTDVVLAFYGVPATHPQAIVTRALMRTSIVSGHAYDRFVDLWPAGWGSGAWPTAPGGSLFNVLLNMYSCAATAEELGLPWRDVVDDFFDNVAIRVLGDDIRFAVSEKYDFHNNLSVQKVLRRDFSMDYTSAQKGEILTPFDRVEDRSLLKRNAVFLDGRFYWALDLETIHNMVYYTIKGKEVAVMRQRVDNAIRELSFHPEDVWNHHLPKILEYAGSFYSHNGFTWEQTRKHALESWNNF